MYILIADDHANVRRGLREIVADAFSGAHFSEAANGDEVLTQLAISQYGVLLLDINMPGRSGLDVLQDVKHMYPKLPVIMVSVQPENQYAVALSAGRSGRLCQQEQRFRRTGAGNQKDTGQRHDCAGPELKLIQISNSLKGHKRVALRTERA